MKQSLNMFKKGLKSKLYLLVTFFISLIVLNFFVINFLITDKKADSSSINLTSRQSVLVQKYIKNFFFFMETKKISDVTQVVKEFEENSKTLLYGTTPIPAKNQPPQVEGEEAVIQYQVDPTLAPEVVSELESINAKWAELKKLAISLLSISPEEKVEAYERLVGFGEGLSKQIDELVDRHEKVSDAKFDYIFNAQIFVISLSMIITFFVMLYFDRTFLKRVFQSFNEVEVFNKSNTLKTETIFQNSAMVNENSYELSKSIEETMSAITELTEITRMNEEKTEQSRVSSNACSSQARYGKEVVQDLLDSIQKINEASHKLTQQIEHGNQEFKRILDLVNGISSETSIINDIVFQTKLLSFNASVEAARAGESGKGFSVVAEEVGNLAVMSGNSAQKITSILDSSKKTIEEIIVTNAKRTNDIIRETQEKVMQGLDLAKNCGNSFENIFKDVNAVDEIITQLSSSSKEQTSGISMINTSMLKINSACHSNNSSAKEMKETVELMVESAKQFEEQIAEFSALLLGQQKVASSKVEVEDKEEADIIDLIDRQGA